MGQSERKILLLGGTGQVGSALRQLLPTFAPARDEADLLHPECFAGLIDRHRPAVVINAAADTAVDRAETDPEPASEANSIAPAVLARACRDASARLVHFSTDYVFAGNKGTPYTEDDRVAPVNAYGRFKLLGEEAVLAADPRNLVFRLSWVYSTHGRNFALTMLRLAAQGRAIRVVDDQVGSPTYARFIAEGVAAAVRRVSDSPDEPGGLYHLSAGGATSWCSFAVALLAVALGDRAPGVEPIPSSDYPTPAPRPAYSVLDNSRFASRFGIQLPGWREQVASWARDLTSG